MYLQELQAIKTRIAINVLALERILEILKKDEYQHYLERAVSVLGSGLDDLDFAVKDLKKMKR